MGWRWQTCLLELSAFAPSLQALTAGRDESRTSLSEFVRDYGGSKGMNVRAGDGAVLGIGGIVRVSVRKGVRIAERIIVRLLEVGGWRGILVIPFVVNLGVKATGVPWERRGGHNVG